MPLVLKYKIEEDSELAVWEVKESEKILLSHVNLSSIDHERLHLIPHPKKRIEFLSARVALQMLNINADGLNYTSKGKPLHPDYKVSLSHNHQFGAAIIHKTAEVGIDVEDISRDVSRVKHKFVRADEERIFEFMKPNPGLWIWGVKECGYKMHGSRKLDFKADMKVCSTEPNSLDNFEIQFPNESLKGGIQHKIHDNALIILCIEHLDIVKSGDKR